MWLPPDLKKDAPRVTHGQGSGKDGTRSLQIVRQSNLALLFFDEAVNGQKLNPHANPIPRTLNNDCVGLSVEAYSSETQKVQARVAEKQWLAGLRFLAGRYGRQLHTFTRWKGNSCRESVPC